MPQMAQFFGIQGMALDIVCFSHLRWNFVYQRPQHLLSRFANHGRVYFFEEPIYDGEQDTYALTTPSGAGLTVVVPHLGSEFGRERTAERLATIVDDLIRDEQITSYALWYYSPMALVFSSHLNPELIIYDCMDELSGFKFAPPELRELEQALFKKADLVFTGGHHLYQAKKHQHKSIHPFPSSIDKEHFVTARNIAREPADQKNIPHPRLGFYGVLDERLDIELVDRIASARPDWQIVLIGPVVKIDPASLPRRNNIHYLGGKDYKDLPSYLAGWDVAIMPFALNESTRFISPTKTPEYLCGGKPVVSTAITDVVNDYGKTGLVHIAHNADEFIEAVEKIFKNKNYNDWLARVDNLLAGNSWDITWRRMQDLIKETYQNKSIHNKRIAHV
jgi:glycosyltransferase involved in cell wall biosynthesis